MTPEAFEQSCKGKGYCAPKQVRFEPLSRSAPHVHDQVSFVYFVEGEFILNTAVGAPPYLAGETCILDKNREWAKLGGYAAALW